MIEIADLTVRFGGVKPLDGKVALITGSSRGIGAAGPFGIRVNCLAPETILTEHNDAHIPEAVKASLIESFVRYARDIGCDSVDGSSASMFGDRYIHKFCSWLSQLDAQGTLWPAGGVL